MRLQNHLTLASLLPFTLADPVPPIPPPKQQPLSDQQHLLPSHPDSSSSLLNDNGVSVPFFASLERAARLVDIAYCVGTTGISPPFSCVSRCKDFPSLRLIRTWNTGV